MPCFFKKRSPEVTEPHTVAYYQRSSMRAIDSLEPGEYQLLCDPQGRTFSVTHLPTGHTVNSHADTAIDYYASIVDAVDRIKIVVEMEAFKP